MGVVRLVKIALRFIWLFHITVQQLKPLAPVSYTTKSVISIQTGKFICKSKPIVVNLFWVDYWTQWNYPLCNLLNEPSQRTTHVMSIPQRQWSSYQRKSLNHWPVQKHRVPSLNLALTGRDNAFKYWHFLKVFYQLNSRDR